MQAGSLNEYSVLPVAESSRYSNLSALSPKQQLVASTIPSTNQRPNLVSTHLMQPFQRPGGLQGESQAHSAWSGQMKVVYLSSLHEFYHCS
jgi:hypothetical protein